MKTITRAEFMADPDAALRMSHDEPVQVIGEDGEVRMTLSSPVAVVPHEHEFDNAAVGAALDRCRQVQVTRDGKLIAALSGKGAEESAPEWVDWPTSEGYWHHRVNGRVCALVIAAKSKWEENGPDVICVRHHGVEESWFPAELPAEHAERHRFQRANVEPPR